MEDIYNPLEFYQSTLQPDHARNVAEFFENLLAGSGVDEAANAALVSEIRQLEKLLGETSRRSHLWKLLRVVLFIAAAGCLYTAYSVHWAYAAGAIMIGAVIFLKLNPYIKSIDSHHDRLKATRDTREAAAWQQMAPLNNKYDWADFANLANKTLPRIEFDNYFTKKRLDYLRRSFGWNDEFNHDRAVIFSHSGVINGNPFIIVQTVRHWIGTKTYHGSLHITWTERVRNTNGSWSTVTRSQTLTASVTKPFPRVLT